MKLRIVTIFILIIIAGMYCKTPLKRYSHENRYLIAILKVENKSKTSVPESQLDSIREILINELHQSGRVRLIERDRIDAILIEQKLYASGLIDAKMAMQIGKLLGSDAVLISYVSNFLEELEEIKAPVTHVKELTMETTLSGRLIDTNTGEILATGIAREKDTIEEVLAGPTRVGNFDKAALTNKILNKASTDLGYQLAKSIPPKAK
jgi:curli biogenesis system outer membrane secretion channel CsgG